jgi:hypothetical protein
MKRIADKGVVIAFVVALSHAAAPAGRETSVTTG